MINEAAIILAAGVPAVWMDHRSRRIPNVLVALTLAAALLLAAWSGGMAGVGRAAAGAATGLACFLPMHLIGAMGAGDVKFMAALGALLGPAGALAACAVALVAGGVLAVAIVGWSRFAELPAVEEVAASASPGRERALQMPYAAAIVVGALTAALAGAIPH